MSRKATKMRKFTQWCVLVLLFCFLIGSVSARTDVYELEPATGATKDLRLTVQSSVVGNLTVENGSINFFVTNPSGNIVFCYNDTAYTNFTFTASEDGNYTFHLVNLYSPENVTATMIYSINFVVVVQEKIDMSWNLVETVQGSLVTPPPFDPGRPKKPNLEDLYRRYFNFLGAKQIIKMVEEIWDYMPVSTSLLFGLVLLTGALLIRKRQHFRPLKPNLRVG